MCFKGEETETLGSWEGKAGPAGAPSCAGEPPRAPGPGARAEEEFEKHDLTRAARDAADITYP